MFEHDRYDSAQSAAPAAILPATYIYEKRKGRPGFEPGLRGTDCPPQLVVKTTSCV
jgi:hypothetical protein